MSTFLFCCLIFKLKLILFYNRIIFYHTRIFLILLPHPAVDFAILAKLRMKIKESEKMDKYQRTEKAMEKRE